jgi:enoyl-CoA hydratase/carnithine racemase
MNQDGAEVLYEVLACRHTAEQLIGVATLNRPKQLNALNLPMCQSLLAQMTLWQKDPKIVAVVLQGAGEKGLCAGGDVAEVVRHIRAGGEQRFAYGDQFFTVEYQLDYLLHTFGKPLVTWAHGITMGGGVGLSVAGSHRFVTDQAKIAMPEIHIGLFPDVGGGWFLNRAPGYSGLLMALTGLVVNEGDAIFAGLADYYVPHAVRAQVIAALSEIKWGASVADHFNQMTFACRELCAPHHADLRPSLLHEQFHAIREAFNRAKVHGIHKGLDALAAQDSRFVSAANNLNNGSPTAAAVVFEYMRRTRQMSLQEVLHLDLTLAKQFARGADFPEGVRALLIDKDKAPKWFPADATQVSSALIEKHFTNAFH